MSLTCGQLFRLDAVVTSYPVPSWVFDISPPILVAVLYAFGLDALAIHKRLHERDLLFCLFSEYIRHRFHLFYKVDGKIKRNTLVE